MKFLAEIDVMPHRELLDPQGKTVGQSLQSLGMAGVQDVRMGKHIRVTLEAADEAAARAQVESSCKQLLVNPVMESFSYRISAI